MRRRLPILTTAITLGASVLVITYWGYRWYVRREAIARHQSDAATAYVLGDDGGVRSALGALREIDLEAATAVSLAYGFDGDSATSRLAGAVLVDAAARLSTRGALLEEADGENTNVRARIWIVIALGSIARESDAALEELHEAIEDPDRNLVLAAIEELREAADPRSLHVLRGRLERCTHRDQIYWNLESAIREIERDGGIGSPDSALRGRDHRIETSG